MNLLSILYILVCKCHRLEKYPIRYILFLLAYVLFTNAGKFGFCSGSCTLCDLAYTSLYYINFLLPVNPNVRPTSSQEAALLAMQLKCGVFLAYNRGHFSTALINRRVASSSLQINEFRY